MEKALRSIIHDIAIGKILIQTNEKSGEPTLHYIKLPKNINEFQVILCDATLGTGAASMMAIRVLIEFGVLEQHIVFVCLIGAPQGVSNIMRCYPKVRIVCSMVDKGLNERFHILPGIGNFGRSYFGC